MTLPKPSGSTEVVITGASSGIGTELARVLATRGYSLYLVARRRDRLDALADELRAEHGVGVTVRPCDLAEAAARQSLIEELRTRPVAGLINNAGFGTSGAFHTLPMDREREQVELNVVAVHELTHAVLPGMVERGAGAVLNVASVVAFQPMPSMATYGASKAFVNSFSEAVHEELRGTGVSCTSLCPGPVPTEWAEIASAHEFSLRPAQVSPADVAAQAVDGMQAGARQVIPGTVVKLMAITGAITPHALLLPALRLARRALG